MNLYFTTKNKFNFLEVIGEIFKSATRCSSFHGFLVRVPILYLDSFRMEDAELKVLKAIKNTQPCRMTVMVSILVNRTWFQSEFE